jgi:thiamine biosynthesis lipoprotein
MLDPRTGMPSESDLHTVTVRAPSASMGDVAAKVALVLGSGPGATYLVNRGLSGLLTTIEGREVAVGAFQLKDVNGHAFPHCA